MAESLFVAVATQGVLLFTGIVAARTLGPSGRGALAMATLIPLVVAQIGAAGVPSAVAFHLSSRNSQDTGLRRAIRRIGVSQTVVLTFILFVVLAASAQVFGLGADVVFVASFGIVASLPQQYGLAILQGQQRFRALNVARLAQPVVYAAALAGVLALGASDVASVLAAWIFGCIAVGLTTLSVALKGLPRGSADAPVKPLVAFGLRAMIGTISPLDTFRIDQFAVGVFLSTESVGLYVAALSLTNLVRFIGQSVGIVAYPVVAACRDGFEQIRLQRRYVAITLAATGVLGTGMCVVAGTLIPAAFGKEFAGAVPVSYALVVAAVFAAVRRTYSDTARGRGMPVVGSLSEVLAWVVLALLLPVAATHGLVAIASAVTIANVVAALASPLIARWLSRNHIRNVQPPSQLEPSSIQ